MSETRNRYTDEEAATFVDAILKGACAAQSVRQTISIEGLPIDHTWFFKKLKDDETLQYKWIVAKTAGAHAALDECIDLEEELLGTARRRVESTTDDGKTMVRSALSGPELGAYRAVMDRRKWQVARLLPKNYGDKISLGTEGVSGTVSINVDLGDQDKGEDEDV